MSAYKGPSDAVTVSYSYINDEHLKQVSAGSNTYTLAYDALGRCVKRTLSAPGTFPLSPTTYYIYDGEKPILEYNGANVAKNVYGKGIDEILMRTDPTVNGGAAFYYGHDHEGSVTHLFNASGTVIESYKYDAYGAVAMYNGAGAQIASTAYNNRFLFTGREYAATYQKTYVPAFNFYEYRARAYNPQLGRFMSEDHKLADTGDYNLFRYCHNDPIDFTDPMGLTEAAPAHSPREESYEIEAIKRTVTGSHIPETVAYQVTVTGQVQGSRSGDYYKTAQEGPKGLRDSPTSVNLSSQKFNVKKERAEATLQVNALHGPIRQKIYSQESIANDPKQTFFYDAQGKRLGVDVTNTNAHFIGGRSGQILDYAGKNPLNPFPPHSSGYIVNTQGRYNIGLGDFTYRGVPGSFEHHIVVVDGHAVWGEVVGH